MYTLAETFTIYSSDKDSTNTKSLFVRTLKEQLQKLISRLPENPITTLPQPKEGDNIIRYKGFQFLLSKWSSGSDDKMMNYEVSIDYLAASPVNEEIN